MVYGTSLDNPIVSALTKISNFDTYGAHTGYWRSEWERETEAYWHEEWKKCKELQWERTCQLWRKAALLNEREYVIIEREKDMIRREMDMANREAFLEKEKERILEQYKQTKKLERQGKRREERIAKAQQRLLQQANKYFSAVYTALQLGLKSNCPQPSAASNVESCPSEHVMSLRSSNSIPPALRVIPLCAAFQPSENGSAHPRFGKIKAPLSVNASAPTHTTLSERHSPRCCISTDNKVTNMNEFDNSCVKDDNPAQCQATNICDNSDNDVSDMAHSEMALNFVEAISSMSVKRPTLDTTVFNKMKCVTTTGIDSGTSLINVSEKPLKIINGEFYTDDKGTSKFVWICTNLSLLPETCPQWLDKYNPHVDWGPMF